MSYKRITEDEFFVQGYYSNCWEDVTCEETFKEARVQLKCYNENESQYPHRIQKRRTKIQKNYYEDKPELLEEEFNSFLTGFNSLEDAENCLDATYKNLKNQYIEQKKKEF